MKQATLKVPRKLKWYIETQLSPEDQKTFWLLHWHALQQSRAQAACAITLKTSALIAVLASAYRSPFALIGGIIFCVFFLRATDAHWKKHRDAEFALKQADLEKWSDIRCAAQGISLEQRDSRDSVEVSFETPE